MPPKNQKKKLQNPKPGQPDFNDTTHMINFPLTGSGATQNQKLPSFFNQNFIFDQRQRIPSPASGTVLSHQGTPFTPPIKTPLDSIFGRNANHGIANPPSQIHSTNMNPNLPIVSPNPNPDQIFPKNKPRQSFTQHAPKGDPRISGLDFQKLTTFSENSDTNQIPQ